MTNKPRQDTTRCCSLLECCRRLTRSPSEHPRFSDIPVETTWYAQCFSLSSRHYASRFRRWWLRQILLVLQSQGADISRCRKRWRREPNKDTNLFIEGQGWFLVVKVHASHTSCQGEAEVEAASELPQKLQCCSLQSGCINYAYPHMLLLKIITIHRIEVAPSVFEPPCLPSLQMVQMQIRCFSLLSLTGGRRRENKMEKAVNKFHNNGCQFDSPLAS